MCDGSRQEFILLSDTLGVSTLVEFVTHGGTAGTTENTVLGPFYVPGSPRRARGESMLVDPDDGDRVVIRGTVSDAEGTPIAGATLDCWQNATAGFYAVQQPGTSRPRTCAASTRPTPTGRYEIRTVRPVPYPIPSDGPAGDLLKAQRSGLDAPRPHPHVGAGRRLQGPDHPRVRRRDRRTSARTPCSASATAWCAGSSPTTTASWRRRSTSCSTGSDRPPDISANLILCSWRGASGEGDGNRSGHEHSAEDGRRRRCCTSSGASTG